MCLEVLVSYCTPMSNNCNITPLIFLPTQDQYVFIHDAVLESLTCGDTQIPASGLSGAIKKLKEKNSETGRTGFETQFYVRHIHLSDLCTQSACDKWSWHLASLSKASSFALCL